MAKTRLDNDVTLFTIEQGAFLRWRHDPVSVEIYPLPPSRPWGTGGELDSMLEPDEMPAQGVLHGDPGRLSYYPTSEAIGPRIPGMTRGLFLSLYVDEAAFDRLVAQITSGARRITTIQASVRIELFQHEVDRFFDEHNYRSDLGMLGRGIDKSAHAIARLERLGVTFAVDLPRQAPNDDDASASDQIPSETPPDPAVLAAERVARGQTVLASTIRQAAWGLGSAVILAAIIISMGI
jgi:hypothetical protein